MAKCFNGCMGRRSGFAQGNRRGQNLWNTQEEGTECFERREGFARGNMGQMIQGRDCIRPNENSQMAPSCPIIIPSNPPVAPVASNTTGYASYNINSPTFTFGSLLPLVLDISGNNRYSLTSGTTLLLPSGYVYEISYLVQGTIPTGTYFAVVPNINGQSQTNNIDYAYNNSGATATVSAYGSFLVNAITSNVTLSLDTISNVAAGTTAAVTGVVTITSAYRAVNYYC